MLIIIILILIFLLFKNKIKEPFLANDYFYDYNFNNYYFNHVNPSYDLRDYL